MALLKAFTNRLARSTVGNAIGKVVRVVKDGAKKLRSKVRGKRRHVPERLPSKKPLVGLTVPRNQASRQFRPDLKPGTYVYVQDAAGIVYVVPNAPGAHPGVLGNGLSATGAGEITVGIDGVITEVNNISYTFQFGGGTLTQVVAALKATGARIAPNAVKPFEH
ncbi:MAG TPA: hypothetical protein VF306_23755 [Pirellulales bacterium]